MWLGSTDGGATWAKATKAGLKATDYGAIGLQCLDDGVCYLAHVRRKTGEEDVHLVDRLAPDGTWRNEAAFAAECWVDDLSVDALDSAQAFVKCSEKAIGYRDKDGRWKIVDVAELATSLR